MKIGIIGLGYVGVQLAVAFGKHHRTIGFDSDRSKIEAYRNGIDQTGELTTAQLLEPVNLVYSASEKDLLGCEVYIVAVPTPVDESSQPNFKPLINASETVGRTLSEGSTVVYESTVYPGATEEVCIPILETISGLKWQRDFHIAYSPERINPGDPKHTLQTITKVVAGDDESTLDKISRLYASIVPAGIHKASTIRVAEAAKVIENTQRDLNIALINELAMIFDRLGLSTAEVLEAASSKWNFLPFKPGLVGGHCIGVDPYYLTHKSKLIGYEPQVILAGRRINDAMGLFVAEKIIKLIRAAGIEPRSSVNLLGVTFKENCGDTRNSQVFTLIKHLQENEFKVFAADPLADPDSVKRNHNLEIIPFDKLSISPVLITAVPHHAFGSGDDLARRLIQKPGLFVDIKSAYRKTLMGIHGLTYWSL